uniref:CLAVATA3/ESR (CLE)-related protein 1 n=1 Tax=Heterodera glycines TaxID=51029 RepID=CLE1_HETGL|nr:RecName: Full=CLAVATA3/ESR (CLE)-related protein 1; Short=CLE-like peptide 1; Short=Hg-SYV46; AltName: Full=Esophageal gland cell secretory protein 1; Flags: Precursor [Heterodera glycines]AAG21331.2 hypothetical esophageal gland cell secretory protein 1 [Heterodera glycines]ACT32609.1 CLE-like peptide 1 [Heterodera glycines]
MPNIFKILLIVLLAVVSFRLSASTGDKKTANDGSGNNSSAGIGTKIKRIVTAGLLFTSLATGGAEAIGRSNAQGGNAAGLVPSHLTNRSMAPPPPPAQFEKGAATRVEKMRAQLRELAEKMTDKDPKRLSPSGPDPHHH